MRRSIAVTLCAALLLVAGCDDQTRSVSPTDANAESALRTYLKEAPVEVTGSDQDGPVTSASCSATEPFRGGRAFVCVTHHAEVDVERCVAMVDGKLLT